RIEVIGTNSDYENTPLYNIGKDQTLLFRFSFKILLKQGFYTIAVLLAKGPDIPDYYDWIEDALSFEVRCKDKTRYALYSPPVKLNVFRSN
ncbi:MAG: hypothetical protein GTO02_04390, partial [Candidatus Dadabacteria bacterium]|nr:hypothetical protein [Candidatus Dadabacteria bacterium]NIQ13659.1 hypothetical protein [Candidatus Dadabacteria bacterium]